MGLDNGFYIRSKKDRKVKIEISYFRKYFELDTYMLTCPSFENYDYEVTVSKDFLRELRDYIEPIAKDLMPYKIETINYFEDNGYPEHLVKKWYYHEFSPAESHSFAAGVKLLQLYSNVVTMIGALENDYQKDLFITFYSSF